MKNKIKTVLILVLILLCSVGCAQDRANEGSASTVVSTGSQDEGSVNAVAGTDSSEKSLRVKQLLPLTLEEDSTEGSQKRLFTCSYGSKLYILASYQKEDGTPLAQWMYIFDMDTLETEKLAFSLSTPESENLSITSMYVTGENELTLLLYGSLDGKDASALLCKTDTTGKALNDAAPYSDVPEYFTSLGNLGISNNKLFSVPGSASILTEWAPDTSTTQIYRYDAGNDKKLVATLPDEFVTSLCSHGQDTIYYIANSELKLLNTKTQTCETLCNIRDCGIELYAGNEYLLINGKGELALCTIIEDKPAVYLLTDEEAVTDSDTIRLTRLQTYGMEYVTRLAASWSTTSDYHIKIEKENEEQKQEALYNRTMMEIVSGQGPELMWVSEEDMKILAEKGALMDISELIPEDIKEQLLPGVLKAGTINDTLVGITPEVSFYTMLASDAVWDEDSWTISDVMSLVESRDDWEWPLIFSTVKPNYYTLLYGILAKDWSNSPFIDFEEGISYFNGEEFIKTLEFCKKYGETDMSTTVEWDDLSSMLKNGTSVGAQCFFYGGLPDFSSAMRRYENCHVVGFPRTEGSGSYLYSEAYLVVNANATHTDAIKEFIACLLDYENQYTVSFTPVRKDVLRNSVITHGDSLAVLKSLSPESYRTLEAKPDGSSYLEEFMEFAESCEPQPHLPEGISNILGEELPSYFTGDKSAREVADIIHNRVQLYFAEKE